MHIHSKYSRILSSFMFIAILSISFIMATFFIFPSYSIIGTIISSNNTSALTYSNSTDVSFTFNPTLSISLSDTNINIDNLLPGLSSESSPITVNVDTNTAYGYSLFASVGNSTDYNTTSLTHEDSSTGNNAVFTSIDTNAAIPDPANFNDNTWGYSFSQDSGSTWSNYNGLPLYSTVDNNTSTNNPALLIDTKSPADSTESIDFKIAAKASSTQASGTYNNIINFYAVGKPEPMTIEDLAYMQDFKGLSETDKETVLEYMPTGKQYQLIDNRDNKTYWLAKQADGKIWMTQNLDLCIGCEGTAALTSRNTDLNEYDSSIYVDGYTNTDGITIWVPVPTAITSSHPINGSSVFGWSNNNNNPYSAEANSIYVYTSGSTSNDTVYNSLEDCINAGHGVDDCTHYSVGNYYNWSAAIASNNSSAIIDKTIAANSICPAGWRLPNAAKGQVMSDYSQLFYSSGIIFMPVGEFTTDGFNNMRIFPMYFVRGGSVSKASLEERARRGHYWSNTVMGDGGSAAFAATFLEGQFYGDSAGLVSRLGVTIRCLVR